MNLYINFGIHRMLTVSKVVIINDVCCFTFCMLFISEVQFTCSIPKKMPEFKSSAVRNRIPLQDLDANVRRSQTAAFADGTLANLTTQWVRYLTFCTAYELDALPASPSTLSRYVQYLGQSVKSHQTVLCYLCGVKTLHLLLNLPIHQFGHFLLRMTLRGLHRLNTHVPNPAPPINIEILDKIYDMLDFDKEDDVIFWAVLLVDFFLLLRKCNLVPDSGNKFDPRRQLMVQDLQFEKDHIKVTLHWTKNSQFGNQALRFALPAIPGSKLCPVTALVTLISVNNAAPNQSLFQRSDGSCYTYNNLQTRLQKVSDVLGLEHKLTSHSLRAGGATAAFLAGVPSEIIKVLGHWKSDCYLRYIRMPEQARLAAGWLMKHRIQCLNY